MQFKVPQNITMEDRIIGPFTAIQFGIMVIGGAFAFVVFSSKTIPSPINKMLGLGMAVFTLVMAIGKFNDQPMYRFIKYIIAFIITPKTRIWKKIGVEHQAVKQGDHIKQDGVEVHLKNVSKGDIAKLASLIDTHGQAGHLPNIKKETIFKASTEKHHK